MATQRGSRATRPSMRSQLASVDPSLTKMISYDGPTACVAAALTRRCNSSRQACSLKQGMTMESRIALVRSLDDAGGSCRLLPGLPAVDVGVVRIAAFAAV